jgi:hypothetical protein
MTALPLYLRQVRFRVRPASVTGAWGRGLGWGTWNRAPKGGLDARLCWCRAGGGPAPQRHRFSVSGLVWRGERKRKKREERILDGSPSRVDARRGLCRAVEAAVCGPAPSAPRGGLTCTYAGRGAASLPPAMNARGEAGIFCGHDPIPPMWPAGPTAVMRSVTAHDSRKAATVQAFWAY